jgi:outer membrane protein assembly factor BamB
LKESLIISTQTGLISIDKDNGEQLWKSESGSDFFASPVQLDNVLYAKSSLARTVFAISPEGYPIGYLKYGNPVFFAQPSYEYYSGIYAATDLVVFSTSNMVYAYGE